MFLSGIKLKEWTLCTAEKEMEDAHKSRVLGTHLFIVAPAPSSCLLPFIHVSHSNVVPTPLHNARVFLFPFFFFYCFSRSDWYWYRKTRTREGQDSLVTCASSGNRLAWFNRKALGWAEYNCGFSYIVQALFTLAPVRSFLTSQNKKTEEIFWGGGAGNKNTPCT